MTSVDATVDRKPLVTTVYSSAVKSLFVNAHVVAPFPVYFIWGEGRYIEFLVTVLPILVLLA